MIRSLIAISFAIFTYPLNITMDLTFPYYFRVQLYARPTEANPLNTWFSADYLRLAALLLFRLKRAQVQSQAPAQLLPVRGSGTGFTCNKFHYLFDLRALLLLHHA